MAYCTPATLTNITTECGSNMGGVKATAYRNRADIESITVTDGVVTAITLATGASVSAAVLGFRRGTCSMNSEATVDAQAGTFFHTTTISHRFAKMNASKRTSIIALTHAETIALVKDNNGEVWLVGDENPLTVAGNTGTTGTVSSDPNEYTPSFSCESENPPMTVASGVVTTFLGTAVWE